MSPEAGGGGRRGGGGRGGVVMVLHSHLPYVLGHGVWPHGEHWLMESAVECYLPLIEVCRRLHAQGLREFLTVGFTPVLAAQLADPRFPDLFESYLDERRRQALRDAEDFGRIPGDDVRRGLALAWAAELDDARRTFAEEMAGDMIGAWRELQDAGAVEILTSAVTHGYLPLLLNDTCVTGQVRGGVATYERLFGRRPRGIWLPECAYRPRYAWRPPLGGPARLRAGLEEILEAEGLEYFIADSNLLQPPRRSAIDLRGDAELELLYRNFRLAHGRGGRPHPPGRAYRVAGPRGASRVSVLARHPRTGTRVWNRDVGYPGNAEYLDFGKQHQGGHRYWRVTDRRGPIEAKELYDPAAAAARAAEDARDFTRDVARLRERERLDLVVAAYDTELFGHWWREGPVWLEHVIGGLAAGPAPAFTGSAALLQAPAEEAIRLPEGSWGEGGFHWVWYNKMVRDLWADIYACESDFVELLTERPDPGGGGAAEPGDDAEVERRERLMHMLGQELVLVESSDWPFLVTGIPAREYARDRLQLHAERFRWLRDRLRGGAWREEDESRLREIEIQDGVFPDLDPSWWSPAGGGGPSAGVSARRRGTGEATLKLARPPGEILRARTGGLLAAWSGTLLGRLMRPGVLEAFKGRRPRVLHVASEGLPFSKTGGLGDVIGALPAALARIGFAVTVVLPAYVPALTGAPSLRPANRSLVVQVGGGEHRFEVLEANVAGVRYLLLRNARFFEGREDLYSDRDGRAFEDNWLRFAAFAKAAGEIAEAERFDIVHCHDWQAALIPVYAAARGWDAGRPHRAGPGSPPESYPPPKRGSRRQVILLTIHNLAYQGTFPATVWPELGLPDTWFSPAALEFHGQVNFLKGGILFADALTTVSPTYAREILGDEQGAGLQEVLRSRRERLTGILNGVDYEEWDPSLDRFITRRYGPYDLSGKAACKAELQRLLGLDPDPRAPLAGIVSRLAEQKGWDLLLEALPRFLQRGMQLAVLGSGEVRFEEGLRALARAHPGRVGVRIGFDLALAHQIEAGADLFLMPSRYEPCGLNQLYSLRYGTVPVVRATGGLADTVVDASVRERGTGFVFEDYSAEDLARAIERALEAYGDGCWGEVQRRGMRGDFSWWASAEAYAELYARLYASVAAESPVAAAVAG